MAGSNCCSLISIQVSKEAGKVVWYSHLFKNFLQLIVIPTVKGFSIVNEADLPICHGKCSVYPRFTSSCLHILCYEEPLYYLKTKVLMINLVPNVTPQTGV